MEWRAFVLKAKTKPGILFTDNGDLFTIRLARSESGFRTRGNFLLWTDSGIQEILLLNPESLGFGFRNKAQGIRNTVSDWNPDCCTWNPESTAWNPKYKTILDSMGRKCQGCPASREWIHQKGTF